jgi:hypothetical protein
LPVDEIALVKLGTSLAKALFKYWLKDAKLAADVSSSLIDLIGTKTTSALARQRAQRQFEQIGERIAENLLPILEIEGAEISESSRRAVVFAAADAIQQTKITAKLLVTQNLDPRILGKAITKAGPPEVSYLSAQEFALYERIIFESSQYIVDSASQFPRFSESVFSEILSRENHLLSLVQGIVNEVAEIRKVSIYANAEVDQARFEAEYLRSVVRNLDQIELFGVDVTQSSRRHRLSIAYVTLTGAELTSAGRLPSAGFPRPELGGEDEEPSADVLLPKSVDSVLGGYSRLLMCGPAGSGKTTLLQWIAVNAASRTLPSLLESWNGSVPFFIRLRRCLHTGFPSPEKFPGLVSASLSDSVPTGWVRAQMRTGRAIVLIDGVDEVPQSHRGRLREWIEDLVGEYPEARYVLTSRPHAIDEGWLGTSGFCAAELLPMGPADIDAFIDHWHEAVSEDSRRQPLGEDIVQAALNLKSTLRRNTAIARLATNPLLCAMLCALNRERHGHLPLDRIQLYEACSSLLLERRDIEREIDLSDYPALTYRQKRAFLDDLAYWLLANGWSEASFELADRRFAITLGRMPHVPLNTTSNSVRSLLIERTAMLREPYPFHVDFPHRTFQEYFAAQYAVNEGNIGVLIQHAHDDQWREVTVLAAGLSDHASSQQLIEGLIKRGDGEESHRHQLHLLAAACMETLTSMTPELRNQVENRLSRLIPPANLTQARELASAGPLAIPYLAPRIGERAAYSAARIRALALIGGPEALEMIEAFAGEQRQTVTDELMKSWDRFDQDEFAQRIVAKMAGQIESVNLRQSLTRYDFPMFQAVRRLSIANGSNLVTLKELQPLTNLQILLLQRCQNLTDIQPILSFSELFQFSITNTPRLGFDDISPLCGATGLRNLALSGCEGIKNLEDLVRLDKLSSLKLIDLAWQDLAFLERLSLWSLELGGKRSDVEYDVDVLASNRHLRWLKIQRMDVQSLDFVVALKQLEMLELVNLFRPLDLSPLLHVRDLAILAIDHRQAHEFNNSAVLATLQARGVQVY